MKTCIINLFMLAALALWPSLVLAQSPDARLLTTFTNPIPVHGFFSGSVTAFGNDRVLIGDEGAGGVGKAYLFSLNGTLLTTFTVADPAVFSFGGAVVAVGDRVLIGAYSYGTTHQDGRAYLFNTNGTLLTTFTNPNPARVQAFAFSVAALGSDRLLIGGPQDLNVGAPYLGAVYVFSTNGTLLNTISNPTPAFGSGFGEVNMLAVVGNDQVLVGAPNNTGVHPTGVAYLFSTNGTLLTTFTNPAPAANNYFGGRVAAVGSDRVVISAFGNVGDGTNGGVAYLFSTNGTFLNTFTNPTPGTYDSFGSSVAAVGSSRVLIGAYQDDTGAQGAGLAYLFSTNGTLLNTIANPTPETSESFGFAVTAVGKDQIIIGVPYDNTGAAFAGAAYLFDLPYPPLGIARNVSAVSLKWTTPETGIALQQTDVIGTSTVWNDTTNSVSITGQTNVVQQTLASTNRFFRLRRP